MDMVCKVCGSELRGNAKFCNKCGVPLSLIERFGPEVAGSKTEMTRVAGQQEDEELPTLDSPVRKKPAAPASLPPPAQQPAGSTPQRPAAATPQQLHPTFAPNPL